MLLLEIPIRNKLKNRTISTRLTTRPKKPAGQSHARWA